MRVRIQPRMLVYAVYLVEHEYQPQGQGHPPQGQGEGQEEQPPPYSPTDNTWNAEDPDQPMRLADLETNIAERDANIAERETNIAEREINNQGTVGACLHLASSSILRSCHPALVKLLRCPNVPSESLKIELHCQLIRYDVSADAEVSNASLCKRTLKLSCTLSALSDKEVLLI